MAGLTALYMKGIRQQMLFGIQVVDGSTAQEPHGILNFFFQDGKRLANSRWYPQFLFSGWQTPCELSTRPKTIHIRPPG